MRRRVACLASGGLLLVDRRFHALVLVGLLLLIGGIVTIGVAGDRSPNASSYDEIAGFEQIGSTKTVSVTGQSVELGGDHLHLIDEQPVLEAVYRYAYESETERMVHATVTIALVVERRASDGVIWRLEESIETVSAEGHRGRLSIDHPVSVDVGALLAQVMALDERFETEGEALDVYLHAELARETDVADDATVRVSRLPIDIERGRYHVDEPERRRYESLAARDGGPMVLSYLGLATGIGLLAVSLGARTLGVVPLSERGRVRHRRRFTIGRHPRRFVEVAEPIDPDVTLAVDELGSLLRFARERRRPVVVGPDGLAAVYDDGVWMVHRPPVSA